MAQLQPVPDHDPFPPSVAIFRHLASLSLLVHSSDTQEELLEIGVKRATSVLCSGLPETLCTLIIAFNDSRALPFLPPRSSATISAIRHFSDVIIATQAQRIRPLEVSFQIIEARRNHALRWPEVLAETFPALHTHVQPDVALTSSCKTITLYPDTKG